MIANNKYGGKMKVETFITKDGLTRYILVNSQGVPINVVTKFLKFKDNCGRARNTLRAYSFHLKVYFEYLEFIEMHFDEVGIDELAGFIRWLKTNTKHRNIIMFPQKSQRAARTINVYLSSIYSFYDYLTRHEEYGVRLSKSLTRTMSNSKRGFKDFLYHINKSKTFESKIIKLPETKTSPRIIKKSDIETIFSSCQTSRDKFLIQLLWESGIRIGEALSLWLEDIEPDAHRIHVKDRGELDNLAEIKTIGSPRKIDVSSDLINLFFDYISEFHTDDVVTNHVFIKLSGANKYAPLEYTDVSALIRRLNKRTGVHFTAHMLRHSSFSELSRLGWAAEKLRERAGHKFVQTTYVYLHSDEEDMRKEWERTQLNMLLKKDGEVQ